MLWSIVFPLGMYAVANPPLAGRRLSTPSVLSHLMLAGARRVDRNHGVVDRHMRSLRKFARSAGQGSESGLTR